ncbi:hypothetical protein PMAYCL1PPCAC_29216, partial [Pristionchus mayeri]
ENASMASYCESVLDRSLKLGGREEAPSRLEVNSILTRDPTSTKFPYSISVRLPTGEYQVVEFDGSTEVGQCLSSLCLKLGMRPALLSGYSIYIDDPSTKQMQLLKGKQKICDCLSQWEKRQRDGHRGRIPSERTAALILRQRHYWRHLESSETPIEKRFLVARMGEEMREGRAPLSPQLADHLLSLYAQYTFGDASDEVKDDQYEFLINRFYPLKMLEVTAERILRSTLHSNWRELNGSDEMECARVILQVLRKWPLFGCQLFEATDRLASNRSVFIALHDTSIHILDRKHLSVLRSIPYGRLHSFGDFQNDFMITLERILSPDAHPEETTKERITYSMVASTIQEVNVLLSFLSFVDFSLLLLASLTFAIPGLLSDEGAYRKLMAYVLNYVYPVNLTMQTCSIWTMVMITTERWFAVCRPLQVRMWCTPRKSRIAILFIFVSSIAYNFVRFFEYSIGYDEWGNITYERHLRDPSAYPLYTVGYFTVSYLITHFLLPFTILAIFNGHVIVTMWRMRRARLNLTRQVTHSSLGGPFDL